MLRILSNIDFNGKKVFLRVDYNVPVENGVVTDDTRIRETLETINFILDNGGHITIGTHFGRPKGEKNQKYSTKPVFDHIVSKGYYKADFVPDCVGAVVAEAVRKQRFDTVLVLENLRFYSGEESNNPIFVDLLAAPFDVYINDAFGTCHRKHASVYGLPMKMQEKAAGFLIEKEVLVMDRVLNRPEKPFAALLGGAKVSDKIGVISSLVDKVDVIIIGGAMAYSFLRFNGHSIGTSLVEMEQMITIRDIYEKANKKGVKIVLPIDHIVSHEFGGTPSECTTTDIPSGMMGLDIGPKTAALYKEALKECKTVLWNGPMGVFENKDYSRGTFTMALFLADLGISVVVGGGDSVAAVNKAGVADKITHISTGGGASLEYIEFGSLPGVDVLSIK